MNIVSSLQSIGFDWQVALAHLINFLLVFWLLKHFVFDALQDTVDEREETIADGLRRAQEAEDKLRKAKEKRKSIVKSAQEKRQDIIAEARQQAEQIVADAKTEAETAVAKMKEQARADIAAQRQQMRSEMTDAVSSLAIQSAEKILDREVTEADHDELVERVVTTAVDNA